MEWNVIPELEHLDAPFEIYPGVIVPARSYQWHKYGVEMTVRGCAPGWSTEEKTFVPHLGAQTAVLISLKKL